MKTIWKFPLRVDESQHIEMPKEASIITVQIQNHKPCLWAVVDIDDGRVETVMRTFEIYGTGHSIRAEPGFERYYVATFQQPPFVWHLFERFEVNGTLSRSMFNDKPYADAVLGHTERRLKENERIETMTTRMDTIFRYAKDGLANPEIREMALRLIVNVAQDESAPQLTEEESQLVIGAIPLQALPEREVLKWPCGMGDHGGCLGSAQLKRKEELSHCPCECHKSEQPVPSEGEWRTESRGISPKVYVCDGDGVIACAGDEETATAIVKDHRLAALVPQLKDALENIVCRRCENRIGWNEWPTKYGDWRKCTSCAIPRRTLNAVSKEQENG